ncbi:class I SAM-dependent methyltransferase [Pseudomonas sp. DWP3-1-2]|uniref:class I SAM-dependent methyltransferase n=1 Tax=Pseudomonas sp. DWP3-1-2 TaxID=2804645 RepID=UPI003CE93C52
MSIPFYRAFEDRHRGSRELIRERQQAYLPFIKPLTEMYSECKALDLGCGRGEWLEILQQTGFEPLGIDLDQGMLEACVELGLPVELDDALGALRKLPDDSQALVSGFHIAEHIPFDDLKILVAEALRVLKPAGLLILETPNAENLVVGAQNFYLDPTHERPIPHLLLSFLTEFSGFNRTKLMRLHEPSVLAEGGPVGLMDVLGGASPDYAIVAQKVAPDEQLATFDEAFRRDYGLALDILAQRYDAGVEARIAGLDAGVEARIAGLDAGVEERIAGLDAGVEARIAELENRFAIHFQLADTQSQQMESKVQQVLERSNLMLGRMKDAERKAQSAETAEMAQLSARLNDSLSNAHNWYLRATAYEQQLEAVRNSTSWRITAPLRFIARAVYWPFRSHRSSLVDVLRRNALQAQLWLARRPAIQRRVRAVLSRSPWLLAKLHSLHQHIVTPDAAQSASDPQHGVIDHAPLTQRGRTIESALKEAMIKGQK